MPEATQLIQGINNWWILKEQLDEEGGESDVWSSYDFSEYLRKAGLKMETIRVNPMTRSRFLNECEFLFKKPQYAVKFLNNPTPDSLSRFGSETQTLMNLDDPHIIRVFDYKTEMPAPESGEEEEGEEDGEEKQPPYPPFYVMELIEGHTLKTKAEFEKVFEGNEHEALALIVEIASALNTAHKAGIIHRDLKPENILIKDDGTPIIIDFGICHVIDGRRHNLTGIEAPTEFFMPPELSVMQIKEGDVCGASDIYSLGKLLYYLISGGKQLPHDWHHREEWDLRKTSKSKQMDSVYKILDKTLTPSVVERVQTIDQLLNTMKDDLVGGTQCTFCKDGYYQELDDEATSTMWPGSRSQELLEFHPRLFVCDVCGNLQYFSESKILDKHKA